MSDLPWFYPNECPICGDWIFDGRGVCRWCELEEKMNKPTATEQLASLEKLQDGWDSYGGKKPDQTTLAIARTITSRTPSITPSGDGSVLLEWHVDGFDLEIWIDPGAAVQRGADLR